MSKMFYTDYVRHAMRFYSRHLNRTHFRNEVDKLNWSACHRVIESYSNLERDILVYVYGEFDTMGDNVYAMAQKYSLDQNNIWNLMDVFERAVAKERGLCV